MGQVKRGPWSLRQTPFLALTMSSREISELVEISFTPMGEKSSGGRPGTAYLVNKRDSYVVVAQLPPEILRPDY